MKHLIWILILLLLPCAAFAQTVTFAWDPHEEAAQLTGFHLWQSKTAGGPYSQIATFTPGSITTGNIPKPGLGKYYFVLTAYAPDVESDNSNEVNLVLKPKAPRLISVIQTALIHIAQDLWAAITGNRQNLKITQQ
jgi:hypothetical protein